MHRPHLEERWSGGLFRRRWVSPISYQCRFQVFRSKARDGRTSFQAPEQVLRRLHKNARTFEILAAWSLPPSQGEGRQAVEKLLRGPISRSARYVFQQPVRREDAVDILRGSDERRHHPLPNPPPARDEALSHRIITRRNPKLTASTSATNTSIARITVAPCCI